MELKKLTKEMLKFRLGHDPDIDPDLFVAHLDDVIRFNPDGCFALLDGDDVIGMITSTVYQQVGWLGWLFVLQEYRQRGLGAQLMEKGIEHIRSRGVKTILLEADIKAIPLYERLGFVEQFTTQHFTLTRGDFKCGHRDAAQVASVARDDLKVIAEFDRGFFHEDRLALFEIVASNPTFRGFAATVDGKLAGYIFVIEATENQQVSPLIVDLSQEHAEEIAGILIREAFKACPKTLYFRCPLTSDTSAALLTELGARRVDSYTVRMYLGESYKAERSGVLSLGCPGKG